jgi:selenoprotein W-related protein
MTEKLLKEFHRKLGGIKLVPGDKGSFEVSIDGTMVFSKLDLGRFPALSELRDAVKAA